MFFAIIALCFSKTGTVTASALNVRTGPSTSYSILGTLKKGTKVTISASSGNWYKIKYNSGYGYVSKTYITVSSSSSTTITGVYTTGYYPDDSPMEGGYFDCLGNKLRTLQDYTDGSYVSLAVDKTLIPLRSYVNIDGYTKNGSPIKFYACDVGSAIKGKHVDICCKNAAETYKVTKYNQVLHVLD